MEVGEPLAKKTKHSILSDHIYSEDFQKLFSKHWHDRIPIKTSNLEVIAHPFQIGIISDFIKDDQFLRDIQDELLQIDYTKSSTDLFQAERSKDFVNVESENIKTLYQTFKTDLTSWMEQNTKINLNYKISMSSACYNDTDYLLCHDDNLDERRIAYILYLSKDWTIEDGGTLDLFDTDETGAPKNIVKSLIPKYNSLVFFEVTRDSFHQVSEIKTPEKSRWSINGWFDGPIDTIFESQRPENVNFISPLRLNVDLKAYIPRIYRHGKTKATIRALFMENSVAVLADFLHQEIYNKVSTELEHESIKWNRVGPPDQHNYEVADIDSLPDSLAEFCNFFRSGLVCHFFRVYTHLGMFVQLEVDYARKMTFELQRWSNGCYTLITDKNSKENSYQQTGKNGTAAYMDGSEDEYIDTNENGGADGNGVNSDKDNCLDLLDVRASPAVDISPERDADDEGDGSGLSPDEDELNGDPEVEVPHLIYKFKDTPPTTSSSDSEDSSSSTPKLRRIIRPDKVVEAIDTKELEEEAAKASGRYKDKYGIPYRTDESDIEDYLSGYSEEDAKYPYDKNPGLLDIILQFHTGNAPKDSTIDYVNPTEEDGLLFSVPCKDNHLCMAYRSDYQCRVHKYINHYCDGYFYNLIITYYD